MSRNISKRPVVLFSFSELAIIYTTDKSLVVDYVFRLDTNMGYGSGVRWHDTTPIPILRDIECQILIIVTLSLAENDKLHDALKYSITVHTRFPGVRVHLRQLHRSRARR